MPTINDRIGSQNVIRVLSNASAPPTRLVNLSDIDSARKEFIKDQVFSEEFYLKYDPFTKFSYFLINHNKFSENTFVFTKCRPKNGSSKSKKEKATMFENSKVLSSYFNEFIKLEVLNFN